MKLSSDNHTDSGTLRLHRDYQDMLKVVEWLCQHNPFVSSDAKLRALHAGVTAGDQHCVNCDSAGSVGLSIPQPLDGVLFTVMTSDNYGVFVQLLILVDRCSDMELHFASELMNTAPCLCLLAS